MSSLVSESARSTVAATPVASTAPAASTAGAWLREARQQRGLHIAALAAMLKVPQSKLEALEADRWQELPDATFARALAKAMCRVLKVDAAPVLTLMPRGDDHELDMSRGINAPFRERSGRDDGLSLAWLKRPVVWGPALLLLAAAGVYLLPSHWVPGKLLGDGAAPTSENSATGTVAEPTATVPTLVTETVATPASSIGAAPVAAAPLTASASMPAAIAAPINVAPVAVAPTTAAPLPAGHVPLRIKVTAESWIEVVDAQGQVLLSKLLRPGDEQNLAGRTPLKVRVGNVSGTELSLRGQPVDLAAQSRDNVARLELK